MTNVELGSSANYLIWLYSNDEGEVTQIQIASKSGTAEFTECAGTS